MQIQNKQCQNCKKDFTIDSEDFNFYEKIKVPAPTWCPECRLVRRLLMRNERTLYKRKCDLCGEEKILVFPKESKYKVYCHDCFYSDDWEGQEFGIDYDFSKTFFAQYKKLFDRVPRLGIAKQGFQINSEYVNRSSDVKNCYLIFASADNEDCYYGVSYWGSKNCMDCFNIRKCERCFECLDCYKCNGLKYSKECNECIDSYFLNNCRNCQNCFGCTNLRNKSYYIFNRQYTRDEYLIKISEFKLSDNAEIERIEKRVKEESLDYVVPCIVEKHSVNVSGNWIENSKNVNDSFDCDKVEDGKYLFGISDAKDVMDNTYWGAASELIYESSSIGRQCSSVFFSNESWDQLVRAEYCINCFSSSDLFGCVGLRKKQYCILNKQYGKESFEKLRTKIKEQMKNMPFIDSVGRTIGYGEFFPCDMLPFAYNESIAQEYFPKTEKEVITQGYYWRKMDAKNYLPTILPNELPKNIKLVSDNILNEIIACAHEGKCNQQCTTAFKIISNELRFYRANNLPFPKFCPNCRHYERLLKRQPIKLWKRSCMCNKENHFHGSENCKVEFKTSYAPDRREIVYCEKCYQQEVY